MVVDCIPQKNCNVHFTCLVTLVRAERELDDHFSKFFSGQVIHRVPKRSEDSLRLHIWVVVELEPAPSPPESQASTFP